VDVFSYADESGQIAPGCRLVPRKIRLPGLIYGKLLPFFHRAAIRDCSVLRVMQIPGALPAVVARAFYRIPYVVTLGFLAEENLLIQRGRAYSWIGRIITRLGLRYASAVIVTTGALRDFALGHVPTDRVRFIPNGVDLDRFPPVERKPLSPQRRTDLLFVGRLIGQKNLLLLARAVARVRYPLRLRVVGEGPEGPKLRETAARLGIDLEMSGTLPYEKMPEVYAGSDVFVLPSQGEGQPKVLLEAFASAMPCVGTDVRGIRDVIAHEKIGLLCDQSEQGLASAIERLIENPSMAADLSRRARIHVETNHDLARLLEKEAQLLIEVAGR